MANYTINNAGSTTCNYPSTVNTGDVLTFNITRNTTTTKYQGSMLTYTFPCDCTAEILAAGAKGGDGAGNGTGGRGAIVAGTISFKMGDQLLICVGQAGTNNTQSSSVDDDGTTGAGGGGTYVVRKVSSSSYRYTGSGTGNNWYVEPLVIAAGGNGGGDNIYSGNTTVHGSSNQGTEKTVNDYCVGGGFSTCAGSTYAADSGRSFLTGAQGATNTYYRNNYGSVAGFGGGGGNEDDGKYGGGGGGYSGGSSSGDQGVAATSFVITTASNISRKSGSSQGNNGEGYVKITFKTVVPPHDFPEDQVVTMAGFNAKVKTNDSWKNGTKGYVKVNNAWKEINKMYTKVNNQWVLTGEEKKYTVKSLIDEGFVNPNTQLGEYNGTATYSAYTAGTGVQLYVAASSYGGTYPTAVGNFKTNTNALKNLKSITFDFTRTDGNTNFNIGIYVSPTAQSGRLNATSTNSLIKAYETVNAASGSVTIDLEEAFGGNLTTYINNNYYIGFYLNNPSNAATTVVIKNATMNMSYESAGSGSGSGSGGGSTTPDSSNYYLVQNGVVNTSTPFGNYSSHATYAKYTEGTGISLYKSTSSSYPYSVGYFATKAKVSSLKSFTIGYERTAGSGNFNLGICAHETAGTSGRLGSANFKFSNSVSLTENSGIVTIDTSELALVTNDCYLGIFFYQTGSVTNSVVIKNVSCTTESGSGSGIIDLVILKDTNMENSDIHGDVIWSSQRAIEYTENKGYVVTTNAQNYSKATFNNKINLSNYKSASVTIVGNDYYNMNDFYFGFYTSSSTTNIASKEDINTSSIKVVSTPKTTVIKKQEVTFDLDLSGFTGSTYYFGIWCYTSTATSFTITDIVLKTETSSGGGGATPPTGSSIFPVKNVQVYNDTEFGALTTSSNVTDDSGSMGLKVVTSASNMYAYTTRFSFDKKFDMSKIEKIIMKWAYRDSTLAGRTGEIFIGCTSTTYNSQGNTNNFTGKLTKSITLSQGASVIDTIEFTPTNWTGENYLSIGVCASTNNQALTIGIVELEIVLKAGSGDSSGGGTTPTLESVYILNNNQHIRNNDFGGLCAADYSGTNSVTSGIYTTQHTGSAYGSLAYTTTNNSVDLTPYQSVTISLQSVASSTTSEVYIFTYNTKTQGLSTPTIMGDSWANVQSKTITMGSTYREYTFDISNLTVNQYFGFAIRNTGSCTTKINKIEFKKQSTGGSTGALTLNQGWYNDSGIFTPEAVFTSENIATDEISVKSVSNSATCTFTVKCTQSISSSCELYLELWSSDGVSGNFIGYSYVSTISFRPNITEYITFTKNDIADSKGLSGSDIGHVALSIYAANGDDIAPSMFTVTFNTNSSGTMPIDDI